MSVAALRPPPSTSSLVPPDIISSRVSVATFGHPNSTPPSPTPSPAPVPQLNVNGEAAPGSPASAGSKSLSSSTKESEETTWGSNFWVTLVDPQTGVSFFACPATGQVSWDPPVGNFVLPPSAEGEWWELGDESRGGLPYYYHTKTGETVWERPDGFVIPLGILQNTALGRRLSLSFSQDLSAAAIPTQNPTHPVSPTAAPPPSNRRPPSAPSTDHDAPSIPARSREKERPRATSSPRSNGVPKTSLRRPSSSGANLSSGGGGMRTWATPTHHLPPIPASPYATDVSDPPSPVSPAQSDEHHPRWEATRMAVSPEKSSSFPPPYANGHADGYENGGQGYEHANGSAHKPVNGHANGHAYGNGKPVVNGSADRPRSFVPHRSPQPQSLAAVVELLANPPVSPSEQRSVSESGHSSPSIRRSGESQVSLPSWERHGAVKSGHRKLLPPNARLNVSALVSEKQFWSRSPTSPITAKEIGPPRINQNAKLYMSPVKPRSSSKPIPIEHRPQRVPTPVASIDTHKTIKTYPVLPHDLANDIQQFVESDFAKRYFSTHRTGFIFRRRVPVAQMMTWQKAPLTSPLLTLNRTVSKEAVKIFKVLQRIMGDRERDRPVGVIGRKDIPSLASHNGSTVSLSPTLVGVLEEERWLLGEGLTHGELRDEIYCQVMKQLNGNPKPESVFRGWQLLCVLLITFPPSKNFETYLCSFMQQRTMQMEGRVDVIAKYCIRKLASISRKGPRGKPPSLAEIETASDAAFNPSTFGESLDAIIRLQERNYPHQKVPIILPFLADGILALGGTKSEGIFRVPGDSDSVSDLKLRIDRGYYTLDGVDDPHVLASLLKLWLRELCDPLVPDEMYNDCITAREPEECLRIVERLPTINRRVILFVVSFLQIFLEDRIQTVTKMTPANLALVMTPNLLRCNSESMAVVFTNAPYEQTFVYHLLLHLKCNEIDRDYKPHHGLGAVTSGPMPRSSKSRSRRINH